MKKSELREMIKEEMQVKIIHEYDEWKNTRTQAKNIFRMLKQKHNSDIPAMKKGLETIFKQNRTKPDQSEVMWQEFNKYFKISESENTKKLKEKIQFGNLGNGTTVWDNSIEDPKTKDYKKIAHISWDGEVKYYAKVSSKGKKAIEKYAKTQTKEK